MNSVLLVDDEDVICAELQRTLRRFGFNVEAVHTLEAAQNLIEEVKFDLILTEFNLKSERGDQVRAGNGVQLVRHLRASRVATPILMFTAMDGERYETASLDAGADDFILKTTSVSCLVARLAPTSGGAARLMVRAQSPTCLEIAPPLIKRNRDQCGRNDPPSRCDCGEGDAVFPGHCSSPSIVGLECRSSTRSTLRLRQSD